MNFTDQCALGESADGLLNERKFEEAEAAYLDLLRQVQGGRKIDAFIVAKIALGLLLCRIGRGAEGEAHALWIQGIEDGALGIGIHGLENGQTSVQDLMIYFLVSAHLHSLATDRDQALASVNDFMARVTGYAFTSAPELLPLSLSNWKRHLMEIYEGAIPSQATAGIQMAERRYGQVVPLLPLRFPAPARWVVDWGDPKGQVTAFLPDGSMKQIDETEADVFSSQKGKKKGLWARLFGR
jgi:hypothetical protein